MQTTWNISSSPHTRDKWTTAFIMKCVLLALLPATVIGVVVNGWHALWVVLLATLSAVASEFLFDKLCHKPDTWKDGSAAVTGLMLALTLSPNVPLLLPVLGSMFAILVAKCCFGGLGKNFINPALAGRCFLMVSFGRAMADFSVDGVSAATPIAELMAGRAVNITRMFLGTENGIIGSSVLALMLGGLALWAFDFIHGQICFSVLGSFTLVMALLGGQGFDVRFLLAHLCGGGVVMGAFFILRPGGMRLQDPRTLVLGQGRRHPQERRRADGHVRDERGPRQQPAFKRWAGQARPRPGAGRKAAG